MANSNHCGRYQPVMNRRDFLKKAGGGFGTLALAELLGAECLAAPAHADRATDPLALRPPHYAPKAKSIITMSPVQNRQLI